MYARRFVADFEFGLGKNALIRWVLGMADTARFLFRNVSRLYAYRLAGLLRRHRLRRQSPAMSVIVVLKQLVT